MQYFPKSLAPNLITFVGFLLTIVNFLLIGYYDYDFTASDKGSQSPVPNWVWITAAINIFVAYTLGKHYFIVFFCIGYRIRPDMICQQLIDDESFAKMVWMASRHGEPAQVAH